MFFFPKAIFFQVYFTTLQLVLVPCGGGSERLPVLHHSADYMRTRVCATTRLYPQWHCEQVREYAYVRVRVRMRVIVETHRYMQFISCF